MKKERRLGRDFIRNGKGLLTEDIRRDLMGLRDFAFHQHLGISADQSRLNRLNEIVQSQMALILAE